jgi:hypothetical protein
MKRNTERDTERAVRDGDALDRAIVAARRRVIHRHRLLHVPLAIWCDGQVVEVASESVELPVDAGATGADEH